LYHQSIQEQSQQPAKNTHKPRVCTLTQTARRLAKQQTRGCWQPDGGRNQFTTKLQRPAAHSQPNTGTFSYNLSRFSKHLGLSEKGGKKVSTRARRQPMQTTILGSCRSPIKEAKGVT
jgi:hypothetical protein